MRKVSREIVAFGAVLAAGLGLWFSESLFGGKVLSPADVLRAQRAFQSNDSEYLPQNRLLMDPVLQFEPWLEFSRSMLRRGRLPLWNDRVGMGAPLLANGQSAVFDPIHTIAYLGRLPDALAWMAAVRLWLAGLGAFLLARAWNLGRWGTWFAGLAFPLCGFNMVWLLYPDASVSIWLPWILLSSERVLNGATGPRLAGLAIVVGCAVLGGHVQACFHVLIAAALYMLWRLGPRGCAGKRGRCWFFGVTAGIGLGAVQIAPLACYLARSPVWTDRVLEKPSAWAIVPPRLLDSLCTAAPYLYGSQRRGHPNLARVLGVHNLNESAGGFAGLITLIWLAPLGISARKERSIAGFAALMLAVGVCGAFGVPPVANLLRALPILDVIDHRRLTLWVAFFLVFLGAIGLDRLGEPIRTRSWKLWIACWFAGSLAFAAVSFGIGHLKSALRAQALAHVSRTIAADPHADSAALRSRVESSVDTTVQFISSYYLYISLSFLILGVAGTAWRRGRLRNPYLKSFALGAALIDLIGFGFGLNPAIDCREYRPPSEAIEFLRREVQFPARIVSVGAELPPNTLSRFGLADVRNYDSVESARALAFLEPLFENERGRRERTSRRTITWSSVLRARTRLREAGVSAIVGASSPPPGEFDQVDRIGEVWIARWSYRPPKARFDDGRIDIERSDAADAIVIPVTFDPGWRCEFEGGRSTKVEPWRETFLSVRLPPGVRKATLIYDPVEVRIGAAISLTSACLIVVWGACRFPFLRKNRY